MSFARGEVSGREERTEVFAREWRRPMVPADREGNEGKHESASPPPGSQRLGLTTGIANRLLPPDQLSFFASRLCDLNALVLLLAISFISL
jgi:hypothetical protein